MKAFVPAYGSSVIVIQPRPPKIRIWNVTPDRGERISVLKEGRHVSVGMKSWLADEQGDGPNDYDLTCDVSLQIAP